MTGNCYQFQYKLKRRFILDASEPYGNNNCLMNIRIVFRAMSVPVDQPQLRRVQCT